jgi:hypothetical protein
MVELFSMARQVQYPYVGTVEDNPMEDLMEVWVEEAIAKQNDGEEAVLPSIL